MIVKLPVATVHVGWVTALSVGVAGVGDSRCYLIRNKKIQQLTTDHSLAQALVAQPDVKQRLQELGFEFDL